MEIQQKKAYPRAETRSDVIWACLCYNLLPHVTSELPVMCFPEKFAG